MHKDWIVRYPGIEPTESRFEYLLDLTLDEVCEYAINSVCDILSSANIEYVKWDMNRPMTDISYKGFNHKFTLGFYKIMDVITSRFPNVLFEGCSGGGGRFDAGILAYMPQIWASDNSDAVKRMEIQYSTSIGYPVSSISAHVTAVPNHQMHRITPIETRANVAYFGTFGYELDLNLLSDAEIETVKKQIAFMKEHRSLIQYGTFYRLQSPFAGNEMAWMVVSEDKKEAIVGWYRFLEPINIGYRSVRLQGLDPKLPYQISDMEMALYGDELMQAGLIVSDVASGQNPEQYNGENGDFQSRLYLLKAKEE